MFKKFMAWLVIYSMTFSPALASAQIQADQGAPKNQQPQVVSTGGGVPQVNINTPNSSGLSYNKYQQFDVDNCGAILNNSNKNTQTQLGGWIEGNPNLAGRQADIILNEVNSANPSRLNGHVEVAGQRAEVIIANPSGIQVNGGGFINASRATLTTGRPQMNGGQLTGFRVEKGRIEIEGQGLNGGETDYTAIISQSASVNAGIWAKDLKVVTGRNTVSRDGSQAAALEPNADEIQGVALDVSALGGMYAGQIKLIGTDKGLGVRNAGNLVAQVGEVVITTDGRLENSGAIHGQKAAKVEAKGRVDNTGRIQSADTVSVKAARKIDNQGQIVASKSVELKSAKETVNSGQVQAGESLSLEAAKLDNTGQILSGGQASIKTGTKVNNKGAIEAAGDLEIAAENLDNTGRILSDGRALIAAAANLENTGSMQAAAELNLSADVIDNQNKIISGGRAVVSAAAKLLNSGLIQAMTELNVFTALFENSSKIISGGKNVVNAATRLDNSGSIQAAAELVLAAQNLANRGGILSGGKTVITAAALDNKGSLEADDLHIKAGNFQNSGEVLADNSLTEADTLHNTGLFDGGEVVIKVGLLENIETGTIMGDRLALQGKDIVNGLPLGRDGEIGKNGVTASGLIGARSRLDIGAENLTNREDGVIYSAGNLYIGGLLDEARQAVGRAAKVLNSSALIDVAGDFYATVVNFTNINAHYATALRVVKEWDYRGYSWEGDGHIYIDKRYDGGDGHWGGGVDDHGMGWDQSGRLVHDTEDFFLYHIHRVEQDTFVTESRPGFIYTGGSFVVDGNLTNDHSRIIVGNTIQVDTSDSFAVSGHFKNKAAIEDYIITDTGYYQWTHVASSGLTGSDHKRVYDKATPYNPPVIVTRNEKDVVLDNKYPVSTTLADQAALSGTSGLAGSLSLAGLNQSLYTIDPQCASGYLIESNPRLTSYRTWISSDFMLSRLNSDPNVVHKRLGDGFYEQRLVREQIGNLTGLRFLGDYSSDEEQFAALMLAGLAVAEELQLAPGLALSAEQAASLTSDIVWMEYVTVETADGPVTALAPKVYLAPGRESVIQPGGTLVSATVVDIDAASFSNSGTVYGSQAAAIKAYTIDNLGGTIGGNKVSLAALGDLNNIGGSIIGKELVQMTAGGDINVASSTQTTGSGGSGHFGNRTAIDQVGSVTVTGEGGVLIMAADNDVNLNAAAVESAGSAVLSAGNDLNIGTVETSYEYKSWSDEKNSRYVSEQTDIGSRINVGGDLDMVAGRDLNVTGSQVYSGGDMLGQAGRDIAVTEGRAVKTVDDKIFVAESAALGEKTTTLTAYNFSDVALGSELSGGTVTLSAGQDVLVRGSDVVADSGLNVLAGRDITVAGADNYAESESSAVHTRSGLSGSFSGGRVGVSYSQSEQGTENASQDAWHSSALLGSLSGLVNLYAGQDVLVSGSHVVAGTGDVLISGQEVTIENQFDTHDAQSREWAEQKGLTLSVGLNGSGAIGSAISQGLALYDQAKLAQNAKSDRASALYGLAAARSAYDLGQGVGGIMGQGGGDPSAASGPASGSPSIGVSISLSYGQSKSESKSESHDQTVAGSSISSGGDTVIAARGDEDGRGGDLNIIGSTVDAGGTVTLAANHDLNLISAEEISAYKSENKSSSLGMSVSYGIGASAGGGGAGWGGSASYSQSKGKGQGNSLSHVETVINGLEGVSFISGNDTTLRGAQIIGRQVTGLVGGDLTIISEQDVATQSQSQTTVGGGFSLGSEGNGLSFNYQNQKANGDYAAVNEQSGIFAGEGGFDIEVGGHTGLAGAVIDSQAAPDKNRLTTATLSVSDIANHADYSAETKGVGLGVSGGKGGFMPSLPMEESGSDSSVTRSAVADGLVTITDEAAQLARTGQTAEQAVASLNRDTQGAHQGPLAQNPDLGEILSEQAEISDAAGQAAPAVARTVGDISERQYAETGDERWAEGGLYKTILQAAGSALVAQIGNGKGLDAALGAAASQLAAGKVNEFAQEVAAGMTDDPAKASLIANVIANVVSGGIGYAAGGETGSGAASNMDRYNRQLHKAELARMEKLAEEFAKENNILKADGSLDTDEAARRLMQQALLQSGEYWSTEYANDTEANAFLAKNGNGTFFDEATQKYYDFFKASGEDFNNNALFTEHVFDYLNLYQLLSPTSSIYSPSSVIYAVAASDQKNLAKMSPETLAKIYDDIYKMRELNLASYESETDPAKKAQISADFYPLLQAELLLTQLLRSDDRTQHIATEAGAQELAQDAVGALMGAKTINSILKILAKTNKVYAEESKPDVGSQPTVSTTADRRIPTEGQPNTVVRQVDENGVLKMERHYGSDGRAIKDIDYTNHGNPKHHPEVPHEHTWNWSDINKPGRTR